jgi:hypothetical protein
VVRLRRGRRRRQLLEVSLESCATLQILLLASRGKRSQYDCTGAIGPVVQTEAKAEASFENGSEEVEMWRRKSVRQSCGVVLQLR